MCECGEHSGNSSGYTPCLHISEKIKFRLDLKMKVLISLLTLFLVLHISSQSFYHDKPTQPANFMFKAVKVDNKIELCGTCVEFAGEFINQLLNIVLNVGVVGGCADLCGILADKTGSNIAGTVCNILCDIVGIKEFISIIEKADLDPIYYCELLKTCPIKDDGDASILYLNVTPKAVPKGSKFEITMSYKSINGTGTGEIQVGIHTLDGIPLGQSNLNTPQDPGTYNVKWDGDASPDPDCDPTQGPCEMWYPGNYSVEVAICNGECGSKHPHSKVYDLKSAEFTVIDSYN